MSLRGLARALAALVCLMVWLRLADSARGASPALTTVAVEGNTIRVQTRIEISGEAATPELADLIESHIDRVWQDPSNRHTYCGFDVAFDAEVRVQEGEGSKGWHQVEVLSDRYSAGDDGARPADVYSRDVSAQYPAGARVASRNDLHFAYMAGALFGAPSEFSSDENGRRTPNLGREGTLTSASSTGPQSSIDEQIVENIMNSARQSLAAGTLPMCEVWVGEVIIQGEGTGGCGWIADHGSCTGSASLLSKAPPSGEFRLTFDETGQPVTGEVALKMDWLASYSQFRTICDFDWEGRGSVEFSGKFEEVVKKEDSPLEFHFVGETVSMPDGRIFYPPSLDPCTHPEGIDIPWPASWPDDTFVMKEPSGDGGTCRLGMLDFLAFLETFSYTCTYTILHR